MSRGKAIREIVEDFVVGSTKKAPARYAARRKTAQEILTSMPEELENFVVPRKAPAKARKPAQPEMFPGYAAQHREKRKAKFLSKSQVREPVMSSRQVEPPAPLTLYHSTTAPEFETFRPHGTGMVSTSLGSVEVPRQGIFMAEDPRVAESFITDGNGGYIPGGRTMPLVANIQNPFYLTGQHLSDLMDAGRERDVQRYLDAGIDIRSMYNMPDYWEAFDTAPGADDDFVAALRKLGHDGAYFEEPTGHMDVPGDVNPGVWVAFDPSQVKSATGNRGSFDPADPSIKKARGGLVVKRKKR